MKTRILSSFYNHKGMMIGIRQPMWKVLFSLSIVIVLPLINGCSIIEIASRQEQISQEQISCDYIYNAEKFHRCLSRANAGDANAAFSIAKIYEDGKYFSGLGRERLKVHKDRKTAFNFYKVAADLGHEEALRTVFDSYYYGHKLVPENKAKAENYLRKATKMNVEWAMLLSAYWAEKSNPEEAIDLYLRLARIDNRHAQRRLAKIYFEGELVPQDLCRSYFWAILAEVGRRSRRSPCHSLFPGSSDYSFFYTPQKRKCEELMQTEIVQVVQDSASNWRKGQVEPNLPLVQTKREEKPSLVKVIPPESFKVSKLKTTETTESIKWVPCDIDLDMQLKVSLTSPEIFNLVNPSVWTVISASTIENLKAMNNILVASAVAISKDTLLTNYHVTDKRPYVLIKQGERIAEAAIYAGDKQSDRCILRTKNVELKPVKGFKKYNQLSVGEVVYSIGSPQGLENTLAQGIISGKRELDRQKIIQTTAPISRGSSGGGLFDCSGNLIGITTFKVIDSEGLNFAIPIEDFTQ